MIKTTLFALLVLLWLTPEPGYAAPKFKISSTATAIEKGHDFEILVTIDTDEQLSEIAIAPVPPRGFSIMAKSIPGVTPLLDYPEFPTLKIDSPLSPGDSLAIPFVVKVPTQLSDLWKKDALYSTRDPKVFVFNFTYKLKGSDGHDYTHRQNGDVTLIYTTSMFLYLLSGVIGVLLGFIVKTITQNSVDVAYSLRDKKKFIESASQLTRYVVIGRLPFLLTTLVIGFGVLLSMAQDKIPINGWFQATALGIGLGIISDEKLISRFGGGQGSVVSAEEEEKGHARSSGKTPSRKDEKHGPRT
ncbi:MAG: hypothetical protein JWM21_1742 [Acidobacteria bacterium]|nr:hypothetical protein [Acidobacteriota bacterium]